MTIETKNYIEELLKSDVGNVIEGQQLSTVDEMVDFINSELHLRSIINEQTLKSFKHNFKFIPRVRAFYLNYIDYINIQVDQINSANGQYIEHKVIDETTIISDSFVKKGEFYYCTGEEFLIAQEIAKNRITLPFISGGMPDGGEVLD